MQKSIFTPLKKLAPAMLTLLAAVAFLSCSSDAVPEPEVFNGELVTSIPSVPNFPAITTEVEAKISWADADQTSATVNLSEFTIETGMPGHNYVIGAMEITGVSCTKGANGKIALKCDAFKCIAGEYEVTGSVVGEYSKGHLTFTADYQPGSMPLTVQSVFTSK